MQTLATAPTIAGLAVLALWLGREESYLAAGEENLRHPRVEQVRRASTVLGDHLGAQRRKGRPEVGSAQVRRGRRREANLRDESVQPAEARWSL
ncbi:hypothetical protein PSPO01_04444 [Paraphaeosphaeria sporulosa]